MRGPGRRPPLLATWFIHSFVYLFNFVCANSAWQIQNGSFAGRGGSGEAAEQGSSLTYGEICSDGVEAILTKAADELVFDEGAFSSRYKCAVNGLSAQQCGPEDTIKFCSDKLDNDAADLAATKGSALYGDLRELERLLNSRAQLTELTQRMMIAIVEARDRVIRDWEGTATHPSPLPS